MVLAQPVAGAGGVCLHQIEVWGRAVEKWNLLPILGFRGPGAVLLLPLILFQPCPGEGFMLFCCVVSPERMVLRVSVLH